MRSTVFELMQFYLTDSGLAITTSCVTSANFMTCWSDTKDTTLKEILSKFNLFRSPKHKTVTVQAVQKLFLGLLPHSHHNHQHWGLNRPPCAPGEKQTSSIQKDSKLEINIHKDIIIKQGLQDWFNRINMWRIFCFCQTPPLTNCVLLEWLFLAADHITFTARKIKVETAE